MEIESNFDSLPAWFLDAQSGRMGFRCSARSALLEDERVLCSVKIHGDFWERGKELDEADITKDFEIVLHQVIIDLAALECLCLVLEQWEVGKEIAQLRLTPVEKTGQELFLSVGRHQGLIYTVHKPICTVAYDIGTMSANCSFSVDQSCIRLTLESLQAFLSFYK